MTFCPVTQMGEFLIVVIIKMMILMNIMFLLFFSEKTVDSIQLKTILGRETPTCGAARFALQSHVSVL